MNRRKALSLLAVGVLAGCGGGGGGGSAAQASTSGGAPGGLQQTTTGTSGSGVTGGSTASGRGIACWGDSITNLYFAQFQAAFPNRQVYNGGIVGQTSAQINERVQADAAHKDWLSIFWYGHNDWTKDQVAANLAASIATLKPGTPFIVLSLLNWATDLPGSANYNTVLQLNAALAQKYPDNYLDMRSWLVSRFNAGIAQDVVDHNNDQTPSSLRFDTIHLNDAGCALVAARLLEFISAKGW